jgi:hypothetical protein
MTDTYKIADQLAKHVEAVVIHLVADFGEERATLRAMEHLRTVLMDAIDGGRPEDMAAVLKPKAT